MAAISISLIYPSSHARALNNDSVVSLAASMDKIGLRTPITVKPCSKFHQGQEIAAFEIVTGRHRLEAAKMLGWNEIEAVVMEDDIRACRLWEISENLHRAELSDVERSKLIEEWRELTCEKVFQLGTPSGGRQQKDIGVRKTSQELGLTPQEVHRAHKIATMAPEAHEVARELGLDSNQSALLEAARQTTAEAQIDALMQRALRKAERKSLPAPLASEESEEKQAAAILSAWNRAGRNARLVVAGELEPELRELLAALEN